MASGNYRRKLAAILHADVTRYSRLMGDDEEATLRTLTAYRDAIAQSVSQYRGRTIDTTDDNVLAKLSSVVDAAKSAVTIQNEGSP
jgi:adenylate cyclase